MMLIAMIPQFYKVKRGQTVKSIAEAFSLPECAIIGFNDLKKEVWEGQILHIPALRGNLYTVRAATPKNCFRAAGRISSAGISLRFSIPA